MIPKSARCGNDNVRALGEGNSLGHHVQSADNDHILEVDCFSKNVELLGNLERQLSVMLGTKIMFSYVIPLLGKQLNNDMRVQ